MSAKVKRWQLCAIDHKDSIPAAGHPRLKTPRYLAFASAANDPSVPTLYVTPQTLDCGLLHRMLKAVAHGEYDTSALHNYIAI